MFQKKHKFSNAPYIGECVKAIWADEESMVQQCLEQVRRLIDEETET